MRPWRCTVIDAELPSASDSDPYFKIKCNDPNEPDEHFMFYSEVRTHWIVTKSKRACRIVKPDLSTAGDEDPSFEIECCDGSDVASPRTMKYRVVKKHWTFNTRNVVCKLVRADLDSAGNDDPLFVVQEWVKEEGDKGDNNDEEDGEDEHSGCEEVEDEEGGHCDSFSAIDEDLSTESEPAEPEPEEDAEAVDFLPKIDFYASFSALGIADKGADKHRALCDRVSKGLADITTKIPEALGEVRAQETPGYGLVFCWDVAIKEDSGFTAAELSKEAGNVGLRLPYSFSRNTVTFVPPLLESTVEVADALFKFKKAVLNQKLAAVAKAGTWVKKKGEALDSDVGKDDGDFTQAIAASIADLKVASNHEIEGPNTNKVDVSMPVPDVSDELNQKPSSLEEKDALDRACKENEANTFSILNAGPRGFGENI